VVVDGYVVVDETGHPLSPHALTSRCSGTGSDCGTVSGSGTGRDCGTVSGSGTGRDCGTVGGSGTGRDCGTVGGSGTGSDCGTVGGSGTGSDCGTVSGSGTGSGCGLRLAPHWQCAIWLGESRDQSSGKHRQRDGSSQSQHNQYATSTKNTKWCTHRGSTPLIVERRGGSSVTSAMPPSACNGGQRAGRPRLSHRTPDTIWNEGESAVGLRVFEAPREPAAGGRWCPGPLVARQ
jgi:hypothetical protein